MRFRIESEPWTAGGWVNAVPPSDYGDMSTSVLRGIILLLGGVICVLSTYGAFAPFKLTNWVRSAWGKKPTFPFYGDRASSDGIHADLRRAGVEVPGFL